MRKNWPVLLMLIIAGVAYGLFVMPWVQSYGHWWITVIFYAALVVSALYCRCNRDPIHTESFHRKVRRTPQSL
jgi:cytochrome c biogenesis protein ResB